ERYGRAVFSDRNQELGIEHWSDFSTDLTNVEFSIPNYDPTETRLRASIAGYGPSYLIGDAIVMTSDKTTDGVRSTAGRPSVVIVGGGFGGLYAARGLAGAPVRVTVIDKRNYHLFRPMLYQVATGLLSADEIAAPLRAILRKQKNVEVLMTEVVGVDPENQIVETVDARLHYDYLILATGIHYNYFGHDEWKPLAPGLDSVDDADRIRGKILTAFETAERTAAEFGTDPQELRDLLTFVLVGGGTAGVEMAGTIAEMARLALTGDFRHIDPR